MEPNDNPRSKLSEREAETLALAADGLTDKEIAVRMDISTATIRTYWDRIRKKLGATNRAQAMATAMGSVYAPKDAQSFRGGLSALMSAQNLGVAIVDLRGQVLEANDAYLKMIGYSRDDLEKGLINWQKMTPHEYDERDRQAAEETLKKGISTPYEKELITKSGARIRIRRAGALIHPPNEIVSYVVSLAAHAESPHADKVNRFACLLD